MIPDAFEVVGVNDDPGWAARRREGVGSSDAAMMMGRHPRWTGGGPAVLWAWKTQRDEPDDLSEAEFVRWGHRMEPVIIAAYADEEYSGRPGLPLRVQLRSTRHPWAMCTLDGCTIQPEWGWCPLEAKNVGSYQAERWVDGVPPEMFWQLQQQILVTGSGGAVIAACVGGNALWWEDVARDEKAQRALVQDGARFWQCVERDEVPMYTPTLASCRALYREERPELGVRPLHGNEWLELAEERESLAAAVKSSQARLAEINAAMRDAIGHHDGALLDDGTTYTCRTTRRSNGTSFRMLRRSKKRG